MDDIVAVEIQLENGARRYFLTFGRIQDRVDPEPLASLVLGKARTFSLGETPTSARVCNTLREAADSHQAPYFYEGLLNLSRTTIPFGDDYDSWRARIGEEMQAGKHLYYCGAPD